MAENDNSIPKSGGEPGPSQDRLFDVSDHVTENEKAAKTELSESSFLTGAIQKATSERRQLLNSMTPLSSEERELLTEENKREFTDFIKTVIKDPSSLRERAKVRVESSYRSLHRGIDDIVNEAADRYIKSGILPGGHKHKPKESYRTGSLLREQQRIIAASYQERMNENLSRINTIDEIIREVLPGADLIKPERQRPFGQIRVATLPKLSKNQAERLLATIDSGTFETIAPGYFDIIKLSPLSLGIDERYARKILQSAVEEQDAQTVWTAIFGARLFSSIEYKELETMQKIIANLKPHDINGLAKDKAERHFAEMKKAKKGDHPRRTTSIPLEAADYLEPSLPETDLFGRPKEQDFRDTLYNPQRKRTEDATYTEEESSGSTPLDRFRDKTEMAKEMTDEEAERLRWETERERRSKYRE